MSKCVSTTPSCKVAGPAGTGSGSTISLRNQQSAGASGNAEFLEAAGNVNGLPIGIIKIVRLPIALGASIVIIIPVHDVIAVSSGPPWASRRHLGQSRVKIPKLLQRFRAGPRFGGRATQAILHQPDRHMNAFLNPPPKK